MIPLGTKFHHVTISNAGTTCCHNTLKEECHHDEVRIFDTAAWYVENNYKSEILNQHGYAENLLSTIDVTHPGDEYSSYTEA